MHQLDGECWDISCYFLLVSFFLILRMVISLYIYYVHERMKKSMKNYHSSIWRNGSFLVSFHHIFKKNPFDLGTKWFHPVFLCGISLQPSMRLNYKLKSLSWYSNCFNYLCWVANLETKISHLPYFSHGSDTNLLGMQKLWS